MDVLKKSVILFGILKVIAGKECSKKSNKIRFRFEDKKNDSLTKYGLNESKWVKSISRVLTLRLKPHFKVFILFVYRTPT